MEEFDVAIPGPRAGTTIIEHPAYYAERYRIIRFLSAKDGEDWNASVNLIA